MLALSQEPIHAFYNNDIEQVGEGISLSYSPGWFEGAVQKATNHNKEEIRAYVPLYKLTPNIRKSQTFYYVKNKASFQTIKGFGYVDCKIQHVDPLLYTQFSWFCVWLDQNSTQSVCFDQSGFVWSCGLRYWACLLLSCSGWPQLPSQCTYFSIVQCSLGLRVALELCHMYLGVPPIPSRVLEVVLNSSLLFLFFYPFPLSISRLFARHGTVHGSRVPHGCLCAGSHAFVHHAPQGHPCASVFYGGVKIPTRHPYSPLSHPLLPVATFLATASLSQHPLSPCRPPLPLFSPFSSSSCYPC